MTSGFGLYFGASAMPLSKNLNTYYDVAQVLVSLRQIGGGFYELNTHGEAVMWRSRAYYYRSLLGKADRERLGNVPGYAPVTDWDDMFLTVIDTKVKVEFGRLKGTLTGLDGASLEPVKPAVRKASERRETSAQPTGEPLDLSDLEAEAQDLIGKLG